MRRYAAKRFDFSPCLPLAANRRSMVSDTRSILSLSLGLALALSGCAEVPQSTNADAANALAAGELRAAQAHVGAVFSSGAADTQTQRIKLDLMLRLGDGYAAMAAIEALPDEGLNEGDRRVATAHALVLQGKPQDAADQYEGMEAEAFTEQDFRMTLWALRDLELGEEFEAGMNAGLERFPESPDLNAMAAQALIELDEYEEAAQHAERALAADPDHFEARLAMGEIAIEQEDLEAALRHYQAASRVYPDFAVPHANVAGLLLDLNRIDEAGEALKAARQAGEEEPFVQWQFARYALAMNDLDTARVALETARRTYRGDDEFTLFSARAEEAFGNRQLALSEYQRYLKAVGEDDAIEAKVAQLETQG